MLDTARCKTTSEGRDLTLTAIINAPPEKVFQAWTDPQILQQWFVPPPWSVSRVELDVRTGGSTMVVMRSPEGQDVPNPGVYLEVIPNRRLVMTDAYTEAWKPCDKKPFCTMDLRFEPHGDNQTLYTARVQHWTIEEREAHEKMGFHEGWSTCTEQLAALVEPR